MDPWLQEDPWSIARKEGDKAGRSEPVDLQIAPGQFVSGQGEDLPILPHVTEEANGVAMVAQDDVATFMAAGIYLCEGELGAVVAGHGHGKFPAEHITFAANHGTQKVLLKRVLVNLGRKPVVMRQSLHRVDFEFKNLVTHTPSRSGRSMLPWNVVQRNPLRYVWATIDGLQRHAASTWARK